MNPAPCTCLARDRSTCARQFKCEASELPPRQPAVWNKRTGYPAGTVAIDRTTRYGNPFRIGIDGTRDEVCDKFEAWVKTKKKLIARAKIELRGKDLVCWCEPHRCHGRTWLRIANS